MNENVCVCVCASASSLWMCTALCGCELAHVLLEVRRTPDSCIPTPGIMIIKKGSQCSKAGDLVNQGFHDYF